jgi:hypothetical protein
MQDGTGDGALLYEDDADETTALVEKNSDSRNALLYAGLPALCVYVFGVIFLMHVENWPFVTASYVVTQMVTTIGYGDFTVTTKLAKVFMGFYAFLVLIIMAYAYNLIIGKVVDWECDMLRSHFRKLEIYQGGAVSEKEAKEKYGSTNKVLAATFVFLQVFLGGIVFFRLFENCSCSYGLGKIAGCDNTDFLSCSATGGYVKGWADCFYMSAITLATIGFGDFQPRSHMGRLFGIIWMLVGVVSTATFLSSLAAWLFESSKRKAFTKSDVILSVTEQSFKQIDRDHDGNLSRGEYLAFTLTKYGLVTEELIEEIFKQYDDLDVRKNNKVSWEMIKQRQRTACRNMRRHKTLAQLKSSGI